MSSQKRIYLSGRVQLLLVFFIGYVIFTVFLIGYNGIKTTFFPPSTQTPYPTYTPYPTITPTKRAPLSATHAYDNQNEGCYKWSEVTPLMIGRDICVYGTVLRNTPIAGSTTQIRFTDDENKFFLASGTYYYPDVGKGDCVMAHGKVLKNTYGIPYIDIANELKTCNFD